MEATVTLKLTISELDTIRDALRNEKDRAVAANLRAYGRKLTDLISKLNA